MVTRTEKAYKNPRSTMADGRLTGQARNISAPMRQGGVMRAAAEGRRRREGAPPVPHTRPPVSTQQRAEAALARGAEQAGPGAIANAAVSRLRGAGLGSQAMGGGGGQPPPKPTPFGPQYKPGTELETELPRIPSAPAPEFEPIYARGGQQPGMKPKSGKKDTNIYAEYLKGQEEGWGTPIEEWAGYSGGGIGWEPGGGDDGGKGWQPGDPVPLPGGTPHPKPIYDDITGEVIGWTDGDGKTYDADGNLLAHAPVSDDPWDPEADKFESEKPPTVQELIDMYLADDSEAVSVEDVLGQHYGLDQAQASAGTDLASMMGGLGMGRSGQHMQGQTAMSAQTHADKLATNLQAATANANFAAEKAKNIIQIHGQGLDRAERAELFDELMARQKDVDKFSIAEYLLGLSGNDQFDLAGLGKFFEMYDQGASLDEVLDAMVEGGHMSAKAAADNRGFLEKIWDSTVGMVLGSKMNPVNWFD